MSRTPPKFFLEALRRFDPNLRVRWSTEDVVLPGPLARKRKAKSPKGPMNRWRIEIWNEKSKKHEHVMWVVAEGWEYRDLGEDLLIKLRKCDSQQYGVGTPEWELGGRRQLMNALGLKEDETDPYIEEVDKMVAHRYHQNVGELAERLKYVMSKDMSICAPTGEKEKIYRGREDAQRETDAALEEGRGILVWDEKLQTARLSR